MHKLLVFEIDQFYSSRKEIFKHENAVGFMDNNPNLWSTIDGIPIYPLNRVKEICLDSICLMTGMSYHEIG